MNEIEAKLCKAFSPVLWELCVQREMPGSEAMRNLLGKCLLEVDSGSDDDLATVYYLKVRPPELTAMELKRLANCFDQLCVFEPHDDEFKSYPRYTGLEIDGKKYIIGDGDDGNAVMFRDGAFYIWVRHFKWQNGDEGEDNEQAT